MHPVPILVGLQLLQISMVFAGVGADFNLTDFMQHRQKRGLIFEGGGTIKFVAGPTLPVNLADPITFRSLVISHTIQGGQYPIVNSPLYPWDKWEDTFARSMSQSAATNSFPLQEDDSRLFVYTVLESYMNAKLNVDGRECLRRAICENAQADQHVGLLAELLNILLTPAERSVDPIYTDAYTVGKSGVDCRKLYKKCPSGASLFDQYINEL